MLTCYADSRRLPYLKWPTLVDPRPIGLGKRCLPYYGYLLGRDGQRRRRRAAEFVGRVFQKGLGPGPFVRTRRDRSREIVHRVDARREIVGKRDHAIRMDLLIVD